MKRQNKKRDARNRVLNTHWERPTLQAIRLLGELHNIGITPTQRTDLSRFLGMPTRRIDNLLEEIERYWHAIQRRIDRTGSPFIYGQEESFSSRQ